MKPRMHLGSTLLAALLLVVPPALVAQEDDDGWKMEWNNTSTLTSPDGSWRLRFGGRLQADWTFALSADDELEAAVGELEDGNEFRRARLYFDGKVYDRIEFKVQYDFAGGDADFKDAYIGFLGSSVGDIRLGHFKEPFSLEELTSSNNMAFLERGLPNVFAPSRNTGIMLHDKQGDLLNWGVGVFRESDGFGDATGDDINLTGRITYRPIYEDGGRQMLHVGISASAKDTEERGSGFRLRQRPEVHQAPRFIDTQGFFADGMDLIGLEIAGVHGPFWYSGEYIDADVDRPGLGTAAFDGFYVDAGYYLTGEHRRFRTSSGVFDRQKPKSNWGKDGGSGAWEVAIRFSQLDLSDVARLGGELDTVTLALNWYPNPVTRMMLNWVSADTDNIGGGDYALLRAQITF